ncbi:MAG: DUF2892 domain-containing protein [Helicobacteraceae bacterium]|jgi:hypothetical protein|nr:DUF2892 domain-containing protein [Helicobacteraceae bacterium]
MKRNQHIIDRVARIVLGLALGVTTLLSAFGPYLSWVLAAIGVVLIVTGAIGICPIYSLFKRSTNKESCCASAKKSSCCHSCEI